MSEEARNSHITTIFGLHSSPLHTTPTSCDHRAWLIAVVIWVLLMLALVASCVRSHLSGRGPSIFCRLSQYLHRTIGWITSDGRLWNKVLKHFRTLRLGNRQNLRFSRMRRHRRRSARADLEADSASAAAGASGLKQPIQVTHSNELIDLAPSKTSSTIDYTTIYINHLYAAYQQPSLVEWVLRSRSPRDDNEVYNLLCDHDSGFDIGTTAPSPPDLAGESQSTEETMLAYWRG